MITVKTYLYPNLVEVQVFDPTIFTTRNRQVYSRPIKVYQGIDNPVQVIVRNQDQKGVNLTGSNMLASIQDPTNQVTVISYPVIFSDITRGLGSFVLDRETIDGLEQRFYKLTFSTTFIETDVSRPVYIDDNYGVPLDLEVLPAYYQTTSAPSGSDTYTMDGGSL